MKRPTGPAHGLPSLSIGIDENGLGPRLGPMIVTGVVARTHGAGTRIANSKPKGRLAERLGDSKKLVSFGNAALGEAWARAIALRTGIGASASGPDELIHAFALESQDSLRALCPTRHVDQCWNAKGEAFESDDELRGKVAKDLETLATKGIEIVGVHVGIVCTKRLNAAVTVGLSRFDVDLHTMERIILAARASEQARENQRDPTNANALYATCGKVGGFDKYAERFASLGQHAALARIDALVEGRARSEYAIDGVGTVAFVRDADDTHMLVCLASLVGKWVRECLMSRIVRFHRAHDPKLPEASGYHDPVTTRFIDQSRLARKKRKIDDDCFERTALGKRPAGRDPTSTAPAPKSEARKTPREQMSLLPEPLPPATP